VTLDDVTSGSHAASGHVQWYILFYYYSKKKLGCARAENISGHVTDVTFGSVTSGDVTSGQGRFR
jgi:hypothetical protein